MELEKFKNTEYIKCIDLLDKLIDLDADSKEKVYGCFQSMGIKDFFRHLGSFDLSIETSEKLKSIKFIIDMFDEEGGQA